MNEEEKEIVKPLKKKTSFGVILLIIIVAFIITVGIDKLFLDGLILNFIKGLF